ncbi:MAG: hypothetical protein ACXVCD_17870 [Pseudobdellovibrionaceae bacterium]
MKAIFILVALLVGVKAFATVPVVLQCDDQRNLIFDGVRSITITGSELNLVEETLNGAWVGHNGTLIQSTPSHGSIFKLNIGVEVTIPEALLMGKVVNAPVGLSTYGYPYEKTECSLLK